MPLHTPPPPAAISALLQGAARRETPCGHGTLVWHVWGPAATPQTHPPVVLLHGGSGSWTHWLRNIEALVAAGREVWAPDLPGFGDSDAVPGGRDADAMLAPLQLGLQTLFGHEKCDLVGFSFGGMTAGLLLAEHPDLARRLVLVGAPAMGVVKQRQFELKAWRHLKGGQDQTDIHRHNLGVLMLHDHDLIDGLALEVHIANVERDRLPRRRLAHTDALARALPNVRCPVAAIYGAHDVLYRGHHAQLRDALAQAAPDFRGLQLIDGVGHWVQFEAPELFDAALAQALKI